MYLIPLDSFIAAIATKILFHEGGRPVYRRLVGTLIDGVKFGGRFIA